MSTETEEIRELLSLTGSEIYKQIGIYLYELDFTSDILDDESEFSDLFAEEDCIRVGIPIDNTPLQTFIVSRCQHIIKDYCANNKCKALLSQSHTLYSKLNEQNSSVYKQIGQIFYKFCVNCNDVQSVENIKLFLSKTDLVQMGLKNAAKQKLAFRKVLRIIGDVRKTQKQTQTMETKTENIENKTIENKTENPTTQTQTETTETEQKMIEKTPNQILKEMLKNGKVSMPAFWTHFFQNAKSVSFEALKQAMETILTVNEANKDRLSAMYIESILLNVTNMKQRESITEISYELFEEYCNGLDISDVMQSFEKTQNAFEMLLFCDKNNNFNSIKMDNFEDMLCKIDIFRKLLSQQFEKNVWIHIVSNKFISYLPQLLKLAFKFRNERKNICGVKVFESEVFNNYNRMSSIIGNIKSSFYSLTQAQLLYIIKLDCLAVNEEKLFIAIQKWAQKDLKSAKKSKKSSSYKSLEDRMGVFMAFIRFPLMSVNYLLSTILPLKSKLFQNSDDFLHILVYKVNLTLNTSKNQKKFKFDTTKLCCAYESRTYESNDNKEEESIDIMRVVSENKILAQKNQELKEKNHKLRTRLQKEKDKRKSSKMSVTLDSLSPTTKKKNQHRSVTNAFTTIEHFAAVHKKKQSINTTAKSNSRDDSLDLSALDRKKHLKQVSRSVVDQVSDLQTGTTAVSFLVKIADSDSKESQDMFSQMRKRMTDRSKQVKTAHQRKLEKEEEERKFKEEMEATKKRLREQAKKMKKKKKPKIKPKKRGQHHRDKDKDREKDSKSVEFANSPTEMSPNVSKELSQPTHRTNNATMIIREEIESEEEDNDEVGNDGENEAVVEQQNEVENEENVVEEQIMDAQEENDNVEETNEEKKARKQREKQERLERLKELRVKHEQEQQTQNEVQSSEGSNNEAQSSEPEPEPSVPIITETPQIMPQIPDNDYGYPHIHSAYKQYYVANDASCTNPTHLILYAKKNGISGVSFANANKYFRARRQDPDAVSMEEYMSAANDGQNEMGTSASPQPAVTEENNESDGSLSGHSGHEELEEEAPITVPQSITDKAPKEESKEESKAQSMDTVPIPSEEPKKRRRSKPGLEGGKSKKKKHKKLLIAAEMLGKLKKATNYTRFETPLYILALGVAERKKTKDEKRLIYDLRLQLGYKVQLRQKNMKGIIKFIGEVHFTYGVLVGLEMAGNGNGKHSGDMDKIKYFESKRNGGLFVRADSISKVLEKKKLKSSKRNKSMDRITGERFAHMLHAMEEESDEDCELDLSALSKKERSRLERLHLEIGDVVEVDKGRKGVLHYCGEVHWTDQLIFGVEFVDKAIGKYNGTYGDVEYFKCPDKRGVFFTSDKIRKKSVFNALSQW